MADMINDDWVQEVKDRLADRYTAAEIADALDLPVEDLIETYWDRIMKNQLLLEEVGAIEEKDYE